MAVAPTRGGSWSIRHTAAKAAPEQQAHRVGVGPEVQPAHVVRAGRIAGHRQVRHPAGRDERRDQRHARDPQPAAPAVQRERDDRPDQVELLLDRQGPQVLQQRRAPDRLEVREVMDHVPPVGHVEHRGDDVAAQPLGGVGREGQREHCAAQEHDHERGQQPPGPVHVEAPEVDPVAQPQLLEQQRGDEEPGEHEEHVDPEETTLEPPDVRVEQQHRRHGDGPQPVEPGGVSQAAGLAVDGGLRSLGDHRHRV